MKGNKDMSKNIKNTKNKITIQDFTKKYNALTNDKLKEDFIKSIVKNKYISYETKVAICEKIVESTYYIKTKDNTGTERRKIHVNSPATYMLYCLNIVNNYTTLEVKFNNSLEEFNLLNSNVCIDIIFKYVSDREIKELRKILEMVENDLMQNEYEIHAFIRNQVERFGELAGATLSPLLKVLINNIENFDENKIEKLLNKFIK